jgi:hypothetical protein
MQVLHRQYFIEQHFQEDYFIVDQFRLNQQALPCILQGCDFMASFFMLDCCSQVPLLMA